MPDFCHEGFNCGTSCPALTSGAGTRPTLKYLQHNTNYFDAILRHQASLIQYFPLYKLSMSCDFLGTLLSAKYPHDSVQSRVADPDWIRIQPGQWIRIRIRNPDTDPGGQK